MGQMGQQIWMGHIGTCNPVTVTHQSMIKSIKFQEQFHLEAKTTYRPPKGPKM